MLIGNPSVWMLSSEQGRGLEWVRTEPSDLLLHELLTGQHPFRRESAVTATLREDPTSCARLEERDRRGRRRPARAGSCAVRPRPVSSP